MFEVVLFVCIVISVIRSNEDGNIRFEFLSDYDLKLIDGKNRFELLQNQLTKYGDCWEKAVEQLHLGCKHLDEETQSRLALTFANCFLLHSGMKIHPCPNDLPLSECLKDIDDRTFTSYMEFFTHTQSICFFLQSRIWQNHVEDTVEKLSSTSKRLNIKLKEASDVQAEILKLQNISLNGQRKLLVTGEALNSQIEASKDNIKNAFQELKASTQEHKILIFEVFDRVGKLNSLILGGFVSFYTIVFYIVSISVTYLLTSTPRTQEARFWVFVVITVNCVLEQVISSYSIEEETKRNTLLEDTGPVYYRIWLCRKFFLIVAISVIIYFAHHYKNYNEINNRLLAEIHQQNLELKNSLNSMGQRFHTPNGDIMPKINDDSSSDSYRSSCDETYCCSSSGEESDSTFITIKDSDSPMPTFSFSSMDSSYHNNKNNSENTSMVSTESGMSVSYLEVLSPTSRYNLRPRTNQEKTSVIQGESPRSFANVIKSLEAISHHNSRRIKQQRTRKEVFSSSEEN